MPSQVEPWPYGPLDYWLPPAPSQQQRCAHCFCSDSSAGMHRYDGGEPHVLCCQCGTVMARRFAFPKEAAAPRDWQARAVVELRRVEWTSDGFGRIVCHRCWNFRAEGHRADCELAPLLAPDAAAGGDDGR